MAKKKMVKKTGQKEDLTKTVCYGVGMAMGVAATVMGILGVGAQTLTTLLGIGLFCVGLAGLDSLK